MPSTCRLPKREAALGLFAASAGIDLDGALDAFAARVATMAAAGLRYRRPSAIDAAFGRPLDYYTGLVFEIAFAMAGRPLSAAGATTGC